MNPPPIPAEAEDTPQEITATELADELILLAVEHGAPVTCACGASWDPQRALDVVARVAAAEIRE